MELRGNDSLASPLTPDTRPLTTVIACIICSFLSFWFNMCNVLSIESLHVYHCQRHFLPPPPFVTGTHLPPTMLGMHTTTPSGRLPTLAMSNQRRRYSILWLCVPCAVSVCVCCSIHWDNNSPSARSPQHNARKPTDSQRTARVSWCWCTTERTTTLAARSGGKSKPKPRRRSCDSAKTELDYCFRKIIF